MKNNRLHRLFSTAEYVLCYEQSTSEQRIRRYWRYWLGWAGIFTALTFGILPSVAHARESLRIAVSGGGFLWVQAEKNRPCIYHYISAGRLDLGVGTVCASISNGAGYWDISRHSDLRTGFTKFGFCDNTGDVVCHDRETSRPFRSNQYTLFSLWNKRGWEWRFWTVYVNLRQGVPESERLRLEKCTNPDSFSTHAGCEY